MMKVFLLTVSAANSGRGLNTTARIRNYRDYTTNMNKIKQINLHEIVSRYTDLKSQSGKHIGLCPLHEEKTPSFFVFDNNRFKCFGCGEFGDAADFLQAKHGYTFKEALVELNVESTETAPEKQDRKYKSKLLVDFKDWEARFSTTLGLLIRSAGKSLITLRCDNFEEYCDLYHDLELWKHWLDVLATGSKKDKYQLWRINKNFELVDSAPIFKDLKWMDKYGK